MSTLLYGWGAVPRDEATIRSTTNVVDITDNASTMDASPDFNQLENDKTEDGGLTTNQLSSHVVSSVRYVPTMGNAQENLFTRTNNQVSSSGTAAAREADGHWGHGTLQVVEGIEPTIVDGHAMTNQYFVAERHNPMGNTGDYMTPPQHDPSTEAHMAALGRRNAERARNASQYSAYYAATVGDRA